MVARAIATGSGRSGQLLAIQPTPRRGRTARILRESSPTWRRSSERGLPFDGKADVFVLGLLAIELLTGTRVFVVR